MPEPKYKVGDYVRIVLKGFWAVGLKGKITSVLPLDPEFPAIRNVHYEIALFGKWNVPMVCMRESEIELMLSSEEKERENV